MAVSAGKNDFESGLTLEFDAANSKSYSGSGTTWVDLSGNGNNGTLTNGPTYSYTNGGAIYFDGSNDYVNTSYTLSNACSISIWFYNDLTYNIHNRGLYSTYSTGSFNGMYIGTTIVASNSLRIYYDGNSNSLINYSFLINNWYNIIVTSSGSQILIYVNGVLTNTISGSTTHADVLNIGRTKFDTNYWSGYISNFQVFNRAIGSSEVQQIFTSQRPNPSPVIDSTLALYLDASTPVSYSGSGTTWYDLSGQGNNVTLQNSPTYSSSNSGYFTFNGSNQYATGTNASSVQITGDLTLSAWVVLGDSTYQGIISKMTYSPYNGYGLVKAGGYFAFWTASSNTYTYTNSDVTYTSNNNWFHVVGVRTAGVNRIFINGVRQIDSQSPSLSDSGAAFVIGRYYSDANNFYASGKIALARIYNRALTANEISLNFNAYRQRFGV